MKNSVMLSLKEAIQRTEEARELLVAAVTENNASKVNKLSQIDRSTLTGSIFELEQIASRINRILGES